VCVTSEERRKFLEFLDWDSDLLVVGNGDDCGDDDDDGLRRRYLK